MDVRIPEPPPPLSANVPKSITPPPPLSADVFYEQPLSLIPKNVVCYYLKKLQCQKYCIIIVMQQFKYG